VKGLIAVVGALVLASSAHATAHSVAYTRAGVAYFRTTPQNALYQARDCSRNGLSHCGDFLTRGDGDTFADDCRAAGRSRATLARSLRYWARRALRAGPSWRVFTWTAAGGFPYSCRVGIVSIGSKR
jgi:hypothetical protein